MLGPGAGAKCRLRVKLAAVTPAQGERRARVALLDGLRAAGARSRYQHRDDRGAHAQRRGGRRAGVAGLLRRTGVAHGRPARPRRKFARGISMRFRTTWMRSSPMPRAAARRCTNIISILRGTPDEARAEAFRKRVVDVSVFLPSWACARTAARLEHAAQRSRITMPAISRTRRMCAASRANCCAPFPAWSCVRSPTRTCAAAAPAPTTRPAGDRRLARQQESARGHRHRRRDRGDREHRLPHATARASREARFAGARAAYDAGVARCVCRKSRTNS